MFFKYLAAMELLTMLVTCLLYLILTLTGEVFPPEVWWITPLVILGACIIGWVMTPVFEWILEL